MAHRRSRPQRTRQQRQGASNNNAAAQQPKSAATKKAATKKAATKKDAVRQAAARTDAKKSTPRGTPARTPHAARRQTPSGVRTFLLNVAYDDRNTAKWGGARWDPALRKWTYTGTGLPPALLGFAAPPMSWEAWLEAEYNGVVDGHPGSADITLRPHQSTAAAAVAAAAHRGDVGFLLADDVGLGKTYTAIEAIHQIGSDLRVLVLAPLSVVPHWRRSIQMYGDGGNRWCVTNYDRVKHLLDVPEAANDAVRTRTRNKRIAQKGRSLVAWDVVICDEAHRLKNPTSQRATAVRSVIKGHDDPAFVLWMSATAGQTPLELTYLAPLLAANTGAKVRDLTDFEAWCKSLGLRVKRGSFGQWAWERNEADLAVMHRLLFESGTSGLRRRPQDLANWPEVVRSLTPVDIIGADRALYDEAWEEFCAALEIASNAANPTNPMVAALRFRQKASRLRVDPTIRFATDLLEDGLQVAISTQFLESARAIAAGFDNAVVISGEQPPAEREAARIRFQQGAANVVVFTVTEGISLHANEAAVAASAAQRALLVHDLRWSALDMAQIEGRCHRDGERAVAYYMYGADTVEENVAAAVLARLSDMATMLGDDRVGLDTLLALGGWES